MGLRKYQRQIARATLQKAGVGNVNRKMARRNSEGMPFWKAVLDEVKKTKPVKTRKIRKIERSMANV